MLRAKDIPLRIQRILVLSLIDIGCTVGILVTAKGLPVPAVLPFTVITSAVMSLYIAVGLWHGRRLRHAAEKQGPAVEISVLQGLIVGVMILAAPLYSYLIPAVKGVDLGALPTFWWFAAIASIPLGVQIGLGGHTEDSRRSSTGLRDTSGTSRRPRHIVGDPPRHRDTPDVQIFSRTGHYAKQTYGALAALLIALPIAFLLADSWATKLLFIFMAILIVLGLLVRLRSRIEISVTGLRLVKLGSLWLDAERVIDVSVVAVHDGWTKGRGTIISLTMDDGSRIPLPFLWFPGGIDNSEGRDLANAMRKALGWPT